MFPIENRDYRNSKASSELLFRNSSKSKNPKTPRLEGHIVDREEQCEG